MKGRIECFADECYCVVNEGCFCGMDACECYENVEVKIVSGNYAGDKATFQKIGDKLCLVGADFVIEDMHGIEVEMDK